jgi:hypothetical protein
VIAWIVRAEGVDEGVDPVRRVVRCQQVAQRRPEPAGHLLHVENHAGLLGQDRERRGDTPSGVDQRHVEVESHDQLCGVLHA